MYTPAYWFGRRLSAGARGGRPYCVGRTGSTRRWRSGSQSPGSNHSQKASTSSPHAAWSGDAAACCKARGAPAPSAPPPTHLYCVRRPLLRIVMAVRCVSTSPPGPSSNVSLHSPPYGSPQEHLCRGGSGGQHPGRQGAVSGSCSMPLLRAPGAPLPPPPPAHSQYTGVPRLGTHDAGGVVAPPLVAPRVLHCLAGPRVALPHIQHTARLQIGAKVRLAVLQLWVGAGRGGGCGRW